MIPSCFRAICLAAALMLPAAAATTAPSSLYRWDFAGTFSTTAINGNGMPGIVNGATFSGYIEAPPDFELAASYHRFDGQFSSYSSPSALLRYTVVSGGQSYIYELTGIHAELTAKDVGNAYRVAISAPFFLLAKDVEGAELPDLSFESFWNAMATGLDDGTAFINVANGNWARSTQGPLSSLSAVPEPSGILLIGGAVMVFLGTPLARRR